MAVGIPIKRLDAETRVDDFSLHDHDKWCEGHGEGYSGDEDLSQVVGQHSGHDRKP